MKFLLGIATLFFIVSPAAASELNNADALQGLSETKVIFDINQPPPRLLLRLKFVETTYQQLKKFGTKPKIVLAFRGKASRYLTTGDKYIHDEDLADQKEVREWIENFSKKGLAMEQCALAAELQRIDKEDFLPQIKVVANGYISLIGYQNRGYAFVPMD